MKRVGASRSSVVVITTAAPSKHRRLNAELHHFVTHRGAALVSRHCEVLCRLIVSQFHPFNNFFDSGVQCMLFSRFSALIMENTWFVVHFLLVLFTIRVFLLHNNDNNGNSQLLSLHKPTRNMLSQRSRRESARCHCKFRSIVTEYLLT